MEVLHKMFQKRSHQTHFRRLKLDEILICEPYVGTYVQKFSKQLVFMRLPFTNEK